MPTADDEDGSASGPPRPLDGKGGPVLLPDYNLAKQALMAVLFVGIHHLFWPTLAIAYYRAVADNLWNVLLVGQFLLDGRFFLVLIIVMLIHEGIHEVFASHYGFETDCGVDSLGAYVRITEQWIPRWQYTRMVIAPLVVISGGALVCLALPLGPQLTVIAKLVVLLNTASASGDMIDFTMYYRQPEGTEFYNVEADSILTYVYPPS